MSENVKPNERIQLLSQMLNMDPKFWPYPIPKMLNMKLIEVQEGYAKVEVIVQKEWLNPVGIMHGGLLVTLMDEMMGLVGYTLNLPNAYATINLQADFLKSVTAGETIIAEGKICKSGKQIVNAESNVYNTKGQLICKSGSNLVAITKRT